MCVCVCVGCGCCCCCCCCIISHSHDDIKHISNTNHIQIQMQADSIVSGTNGLTSGFGPWRHEERDTQFLKVFANYTMLTPPQRATYLGMFKISVGRDAKSPTTSFNGNKKPTPCLNDQNPIRLFKIHKFSGPSLLGMTSSTLQPHFLSGDLLWQIVIVISFAREHKTAPNDPKPYQTEW